MCLVFLTPLKTQTPREFPYDGLRVELGGDPNDKTDAWMSAHHEARK